MNHIEQRNQSRASKYPDVLPLVALNVNDAALRLVAKSLLGSDATSVPEWWGTFDAYCYRAFNAYCYRAFNCISHNWARCNATGLG